jgi:hypothetical protein
MGAAARRRTGGGGGGSDLNFVKATTVMVGQFGSDLSLTFGSNAAAGNHILAAFIIDDQGRTVSGTGATVDSSPNIGTGHRGWGLRTPSIGSAQSVFAYALSSGWSWGGFAIEATGDAPVFDAAFTATEDSISSAERTLGITVASDNSLVVLLLADQNERTWTFGANMTGLNNATPSYHVAAWGKFAAGSHNITYTPNSGTQLNAVAAFVWSPGP